MNEELQNKLEKLRQALEGGWLDEETYQVSVDSLRNLYNLQVQSGAIAQGEGATAVGERGVLLKGDIGGSIFTGDIRGNVYVGEKTRDPKEALLIYRRVLAQASQNLSLRGIDKEASNPTSQRSPLQLAQVYIDLDTTAQVVFEGYHEHLRTTRSLSALEAMAQNQRMVLLGDPGGGKSTFVNYITYCLVSQSLENETPILRGWPESEKEIIPIIVILRDFVRQLQPLTERASAAHLWNFIERGLKIQKLEFVAKPLKDELEAGRVILLLDGLDEVTTPELRGFVRDAISEFVARYPSCRYLATCRILSYQAPVEEDQPDLRLNSEFATFTLAPFDKKKIDSFVDGWYKELARLGQVENSAVQNLVGQLKTAVRRPDLWRLAPNPMLLTVMALVHSHHGRLPDARSLLYKEAVDILLWRWEQVKTSRYEGQQITLNRLLQDAGRSDTDLNKTIWRLAFEAHADVPEDADDDMLAGIGELKLEKHLAKLHPDRSRDWAQKVIKLTKLRAGLLLERSPELFTFPHRTFQEYLAGAHLASLVEFDKEGERLAGEGGIWREVILLAVGRLVHEQGDFGKPLLLAQRLCPPIVRDTPAGWQMVWLAGDVLHEMGTQRVQDDDIGRGTLEHVRSQLLLLLRQSKLTSKERAAAGDVLAFLGDPRSEIIDIDEMQFCWVPAGNFWMGSEDGRDDEQPIHTNKYLDRDYFLARYPVTVAQWQQYVKESGHIPREQDSLNDPITRPVRWISWPEARKFCNWLTLHWQEKGWLPPNYVVSLPSEAEWEKAARGGTMIPQEPQTISVKNLTSFVPEEFNKVEHNGRLPLYPWGSDSDIEKYNGQGSGIDTTSPVGCFPNGKSPYGCEDMSGNIWEWTRSKDMAYPYLVNDGREDEKIVGNQTFMCLRGGSFGNNIMMMRNAYRNRSSPNHRHNTCGFRICITEKS